MKFINMKLHTAYMARNSNLSHRKRNPIMSQTEKFSILPPSFFLFPTIFDPHPLRSYKNLATRWSTYLCSSAERSVDPYSSPSLFLSESKPLYLVSFELSRQFWIDDLMFRDYRCNTVVAIYHLLYNIKLDFSYYFILLLFIACSMSLILWTSYQFTEFTLASNAFSNTLRKVAICTLKFH